MKGKRTFIAVPLPATVRAALFSACADLARPLPDVKWLRKVENFHVTMRFLGNITDDRIEELGLRLARAMGVVPAFEIGVRGMDAFPSAKRANVIWAGVDDPSGGLARIAGLVEALTSALAIATENEPRPFRAHVTIGRSKRAVDVRAALTPLSEHAFGHFTVGEVHLYESQPTREGSIYQLRSRAPLGNQP